MSTSVEEESRRLEISEFDHTPFYCEENVYFLCKKLCKDGIAKADGSDLFVVFISNDKKQARSTMASEGKEERDFDPKRHAFPTVIELLMFFSNSAEKCINHMLQCLSRSTPAEIRNLGRCHGFQYHFKKVFHGIRFFRMVHAPIFLKCFASDRRHMKDSTGNWIAEPPPYEAIVAEDGAVHNLNEYMEIHGPTESASAGTDTINSVFTQQLGVVVGEDLVQEFVSQFS
ncbi:hypothetical protein Tsubulata_013328 [Turnera subulata]|uniref:Protein N-terminal glutamine amidohydrolase n=1 Tax=Turnera subulata TaxID=218843 RepID=A0A9Q0G5G3_9ROSI|nr:hypothetical protein Tsubulata_013328 [Turnera subulata]